MQEALSFEVAGCKKHFFLPGGSGARGIINWGGRVKKHFFFLQGGCGAGGIFSWGGRVQNHFSDLKFFLISNLKILPIWFFQVSRCHMKDFYSRILKQGLLLGICDFSIFKIYSEVVNISVGHPVISIIELSTLECPCAHVESLWSLILYVYLWRLSNGDYPTNRYTNQKYISKHFTLKALGYS